MKLHRLCVVTRMTWRNSQTLTWDVENRPTAIGSSTFVYDGDGARVKKVEGGQTAVGAPLTPITKVAKGGGTPQVGSAVIRRVVGEALILAREEAVAPGLYLARNRARVVEL